MDVPTSQTELLALASHDNCSCDILRRLVKLSSASPDWQEPLPIFLKHMRRPSDDKNEEDANECHARASICLRPILKAVPKLTDAASTRERALLIAAMPNIWYWIERWSLPALNALTDPEAELSRSKDMIPIISQLCQHPYLIVPEATDVVTTFFCIGARSLALRELFKSVLHNRVPSSSETLIDLSAQSMLQLLQLGPHSPGNLKINSKVAIAVRGRLQPVLEDILEHACGHLSQRSFSARNSSSLATSLCLLKIIAQTTFPSRRKPSGSIWHYETSVNTMTIVLRMCTSVLRPSTTPTLFDPIRSQMESQIIRYTWAIVRSLLSTQLSFHFMGRLIKHAIKWSDVFQALTLTPPWAASDDQLYMNDPVDERPESDDIRWIWEGAILPRMWTFGVYLGVTRKIEDAPDRRARVLISRWQTALEATIAYNKTRAQIRCHSSRCPKQAGPVSRHKQCSGCYDAYYCSRACQKAAWKGDNHRAFCTPFLTRLNAGLVCATAAERTFTEKIIAEEFRIQGAPFKDELRRTVLGSGARLLVNFGPDDTSFMIQDTSRMKEFSGAPQWAAPPSQLWSDAFERARTQRSTHVLVGIGCDGPECLADTELVYVAVPRPEWMPLAL